MIKYVALAALAVALTGCLKRSDNVTDTENDERVVRANPSSNRVFYPILYIDRGTGCHYLSEGQGLVPRLDMTGEHICRTEDIRRK